MIIVPARQLAVGFHNVSLASDKSDDPALNKTLVLELFDDSTIRLVATNGRALFTTVVRAEHAWDPAIADKPKQTWVVADPYGNGTVFANQLIKVTKTDAPGMERKARLEVRKATPDESMPTLPGMEGEVLSMEVEDLQAQLPLVEVKFIDWRALWPKPEHEVPVDKISMVLADLAALAKVKDSVSTGRFTYHGPSNPMAVVVDGEPTLQGLLIPADITEDEEEIDDLRTLWNLPAHGEDGEEDQ